MTAIRRWEPFADLGRGRRHLDFWGPRLDMFHGKHGRHSGLGLAPLDIYEDGERLVVKAAVPGMKPEDFELTVRDNFLTIKGETRSDVTQDEGAYLHRERMHGAFRRSIRLPESIDASKGESSYEDGMLIITFPRQEEMQSNQVKIEVGRGPGNSDAS